MKMFHKSATSPLSASGPGNFSFPVSELSIIAPDKIQEMEILHIIVESAIESGSVKHLRCRTPSRRLMSLGRLHHTA